MQPDSPIRHVDRLREIGNLLNASTPLGLIIARAGRCSVRRGPRGLWLADDYRARFPYASAFAVGNVLITRDEWSHHLRAHPDLLRHEENHTWQWLALGPLFLPAYCAAMGWSWLRTGDRGSANVFEQFAGLDLGGYVELPTRPLRDGLVELLTLTHRTIGSTAGRLRTRIAPTAN